MRTKEPGITVVVLLYNDMPHGLSAIDSVVTAMYARQPASLLQRSVHIHPTVAELIPTVFQEMKPLSPRPSST